MDIPEVNLPQVEEDADELAARLKREEELKLATFNEEYEKRISALIFIEIELVSFASYFMFCRLFFRSFLHKVETLNGQFFSLPKTALWFEPPIPVRWDEESRIWVDTGFYDMKFNEESLHLSVRTTNFGTL